MIQTHFEEEVGLKWVVKHEKYGIETDEVYDNKEDAAHAADVLYQDYVLNGGEYNAYDFNFPDIYDPYHPSQWPPRGEYYSVIFNIYIKSANLGKQIYNFKNLFLNQGVFRAGAPAAARLDGQPGRENFGRACLGGQKKICSGRALIKKFIWADLGSRIRASKTIRASNKKKRFIKKKCKYVTYFHELA